LEAETDAIDLGALHPPYYDGETTNALDGVMEKIKAVNGIIFACTAQLFAPTALMQNFLEYFEHSEYADVLKDKHCMFVMLSREGGEKSALDYLTRTVQHFGGYCASQIGLQTKHLSELDGETGEFIDKATEDFYRAVHKNRRYILPADFTVKEIIIEKTVVVEAAAEEKKSKTAPTIKSETLDSAQEKEIEELSFLFTKKYTEKEEAVSSEPLLNEAAKILDTFNGKTAQPPVFKPPESIPSAGEIKKLTQELPSRFQPHLSAGLQAVIQINITGSETFDGYLSIHSTECTYSEGIIPSHDIIIMADSAVWSDVLQGKTTAQKAFMIGGIKVRGDFVLLTKFDTLFEKQ
jgi:putative sterol carrier protein/multimeric flavodoxin WrbA